MIRGSFSQQGEGEKGHCEIVDLGKTKSFHHHEMLQNGEKSLDKKQNKARTKKEENRGISSR